MNSPNIVPTLYLRVSISLVCSQNYEKLFADQYSVNEEHQSKVRSTLRQAWRDWSAEGAVERNQCYGPILKELQERFPQKENR